MSYAIKVNGEIDIKTVSPTANGAKVNFLCTHAGVLLSQAQDGMIEPLFERVRGEGGAAIECVEVVVTEKV